VVSTVAQICRQTWTKAVSVALGQSGLPVFLPHSSRLSPQVVSSTRCRLEHRPVGPTGAPPLCRVCSFAYGPGLDQRDCPPQPSSIRRGPPDRACSAALLWARLPMKLAKEAVMHVDRGVKVGMGLVVTPRTKEELAPFAWNALACLGREPHALAATPRTLLRRAMGIDFDAHHA
jgi:hypothetical protein